MKRWLLLLFFIIPPIAIVLNQEVVSTVLIIGWTAVIIPLCIVQGMDSLKRSPHSRSPVHLFMRLLVGLLGLLSLVMGFAIALWCLYNVFIKRLPEYSGPKNALALAVEGFGVAPALMAFGWYLLRLAAGKERRNYDGANVSREKTEAAWREKDR